jgi:L-cysteine desulfidase
MATVKVEGVRSTINELRKIEPALARESVRSIKQAAEPARAAIAQAPAVPLSGMGNHGPTKAMTAYGGRRNGDEWPLVRIRLTAPGWTVASDMARKGTSTMVGNLTRKYGGASRYAWPAIEARMSTVQSAVVKAAAAVERTATTALKGY